MRKGRPYHLFMPFDKSVTLNNGVRMPLLGLGVYQSPPGKSTEQAVLWALEAGYRHIDTAAAYRNEEDVGRAIRASGIPRDQLFVTTKLWNQDQGTMSAPLALSRSLKNLGLEYVDLYLLHWPVEGKRIESWRALEPMLNEGKCRALGVSNFMERHLEEFFRSSNLIPAVNQVEFSPFLYLKGLLEHCSRRGIQLEAYAPLTQGKKLGHPVVVEIAKKHSRTPAQVLLRWAVELDVVVIPKSVTKERIVENAGIFNFALSKGDMDRLSGLNEGFRTCWNPTDAP